MIGFLNECFFTIENCSFYNYLMNEQLTFNMYVFLFVRLLKHVDKDEHARSSISLYITLL